MISTRKLAVAAALALAGCNSAAPDAPPETRAAAALAQGDGATAEFALRDMLAAGTPKRDLAAALGEAELLQGNLPEARRWLGPGQFSQATAAHGFRMLGRLALAEGDLAGAGKAFDRALALAPRDPKLWVDIGRLRYRGGEQAQAIAAADKALAAGPHQPEALLFRAQLRRDASGGAAALPLLERALKSDPDNADVLAEYAATLGDLGRASDMLAAVRRLAEADPGNPRVYFLQAVLAARAGQDDLARTLLLRSGDLDRQMPAAILLSGVIDLEAGNSASAAQAFDRLARMQPDNRRVRLLLARALALSGSDRELTRRFAAVAAAPGASPYMMQTVARAFEAQGDRAHAAFYLDRAALPPLGRPVSLSGATGLAVAEQRGSSDGSDTLSLVRGLIAAGQSAQALSQAEAFRHRYPGSADAMGLAGDAALAARNPQLALARYSAAARIRRPWPLARRTAAALAMLGRSGEAERLVAAYLAGDPNNAEAALLLARAAYLRGDYARAGPLAEHALAHGAGRDPAARALRALVALRQGDGAHARSEAERAYRLQPLAATPARALATVLGGSSGAPLSTKARALH
jgi:predicted Zn-dependent protease